MYADKRFLDRSTHNSQLCLWCVSRFHLYLLTSPANILLNTSLQQHTREKQLICGLKSHKWRVICDNYLRLPGYWKNSVIAHGTLCHTQLTTNVEATLSSVRAMLRELSASLLCLVQNSSAQERI